MQETELQDALTEEEIAVEAPRFQRYMKALTNYWYARCRRLVDRDAIMSDLNLQLLHALRSYRRGRGSAVKSWVETALYLRARSVVTREIRAYRKRNTIPIEVEADGELHELDDLPRVEEDWDMHEKRAAASQIGSLLRNELGTSRWNAFYLRYVDGLTLAEIAKQSGVSRPAVAKKCERAAARARLIVQGKPEFSRYAIYGRR